MIDPNRVPVVCRRYLGTPWKHLGRTRTEGLDCIGFVLCAYRDLGAPIQDPGLYYPEIFWESAIIDQLMIEVRKKFSFVISAPQAGDLLVFSVNQKVAGHLGVFAGNQAFYHAVKGSGVRESLLEAGWAKRMMALCRVN